MQPTSSNNKDQQESANGPDGTSEVRKRGMRRKRAPQTTQKEAKTGRDLAQIKSDIKDLAARRPENVGRKKDGGASFSEQAADKAEHLLRRKQVFEHTFFAHEWQYLLN
ncbi:hypothetical protein KHU50_005401 [Colletotrichum sp. SAR 10_65]|nr:hypothetical protein KHU50_005401 [Colletotrichum sp. SAR 10_65]KAI8178634.1 hypothetical protein K4K51_004404 [Colletotrichum sp. SAR 10_75]